MGKRLTERTENNGVRFDIDDTHYRIVYPQNESRLHTEIDKLAIRLAELEDKIEQGKMIELPCKVGTMVYYLASYKKKIGFWGKWKYCYKIMEFPFTLEMLDTYGNNWFVTREEAEKRLKELQE